VQCPYQALGIVFAHQQRMWLLLLLGRVSTLSDKSDPLLWYWCQWPVLSFLKRATLSTARTCCIEAACVLHGALPLPPCTLVRCLCSLWMRGSRSSW